jgi:NAD(P)H-dependent nitrite reductase small subunit
MSEFVKVASVSDLPAGRSIVVQVNDRQIALFNVNGEFFALDNICAHRGGPLGEGFIDNNNLTIQCPWHGWTYRLANGVSLIDSMIKVEKFDVKIEGDEIQVSLE